jgi:hypothetical protein
MTMVAMPGDGVWIPRMIYGEVSSNSLAATDNALDADEEEFQTIGKVHTEDGQSHTFGTSGSAVEWFVGSAVTFASGSTLRVGVKKGTSVDTANGPAARATIGAAAFDVYKDLVGGTDTITSSSFRSDAMASGTGFTLANGDLLAICQHLETTSGTPLVRVRTLNTVGISGFPALTLVTSGPTYTAVNGFPIITLVCDDGARAWISPTLSYSTIDAASGTIGNTNIKGNIFRFGFGGQISELAATVNPSTNAANFAFDIYSAPLGTPVQQVTVAMDANVWGTSVGALRLAQVPLTSPYAFTANTDFAVGIRQTTATAVTTSQRDVNHVNLFRMTGAGEECYAVDSTAGATFAAQNSGKRRYHVWVKLSHIDLPARYHGGMAGGLVA